MHRIMKPGGRLFRLDEKEKEASYRNAHGDGTPNMEPETKPYYNSSPRGGRNSTSPLLAPGTTEMQDLELPSPAMENDGGFTNQRWTRPSPRASPSAAHFSPVMGMDYSSSQGSPNFTRTAEQPLLGSSSPRWQYRQISG